MADSPRQLEDENRRLREQLQLLTDHAPVMLAQWDPEHRFRFANRPYAARFGLSPEQVVGKHLRDVVGEEGYAAIQPWLDRGLRGEVTEFEVPVPYPTLGVHWVHVTYTRELDDNGRVVGITAAVQDISERKWTQQREEQLAALMSHSPTLVFMKDEAGRYVYLNRAYEKQFALTPDWLGRTDFDFWPQQSAELFRANDADVLRSGQMQQFVEDATDVEGRRHCWLCYKFPFTASEGTRYVGGIGIDIIERVKAQEALRDSQERLRQSEERYKLAVLSAGVGLWDWDIVSGKVYYSPRWKALFGYVEDDIGDSLDDWVRLLHPDERERICKVQEAFLAGKGETITVEYRLRHKDGSYRWIEANGLAVRDPAGKAVRFVGSHADITNRRQAEEALAASESNYRMLFESMDEGFCVIEVLFDAAGAPCDYRFLETNPAFVQHTGLKDAIGRRVKELVPDHDAHWFETYGRIAQTGKSERFENRAVALGRYYDVYAFRIGEPAQRRVAVLFTDIMERKRAEEALQHSRDRFELLSRTISSLLTSPDPQAVLERLCNDIRTFLNCAVFFNFLLDPQTCRLRLNACGGVDARLARKVESLELGASLCGTAARDACRVLEEHLSASSDPRSAIVRSLGVRAYACHPLLGPDNEVLGTLSFGASNRDTYSAEDLSLMKTVTDHVAVAMLRRRAEEELKRAKHNAERSQAAAESASRAKDQFLAVLSHELRTPLMPVVMTASLLAKRGDLPADVQDDLQTILRSAQMEARLIDDLLDLTRIAKGKMTFDFQAVDVHLVIRAAADICSQGDGAPIVLKLEALHHWVRADPSRFQQVLWNLLNNARKFTPREGTITVRSSNIEGAGIRIEVSDTGLGIDPDVLPRLFSAFEQGNAIGKRLGGLGLGLAISKGIINAHDGRLSADSQGKGMGTTFTVELATLRAAAAEVPAPTAQDVGRSAVGRKLRILLVEDHDSTRKIMQKLIAGLGHDVQPAASVEAAKAIAQHGAFDLVVSDLGLPDGTGHELMSWLKEHCGMVGIALSGYGMDEDIRRSREAGFAEHLTKPLNLDQFEAAIGRVMGNGGLGEASGGSAKP